MAENKIESEMRKRDTLLDSILEGTLGWRRVIVITMAVIAVKLFVAWCFPITGDEAYLSLWGKYVAWGYYDHPPVLGWIMRLVRFLGRSPVILRLPPIIFGAAVAIGMYGLLSSYDRRKAFLLFLLFVFSPANTAFFIVTTDTPLFLFSFFSVFLLFKAEQRRSYFCYMLSGIFLGLALLSKYFAALLAFSYLFFLLRGRRDARRIKGFLLLALAALPFVLQNIVWNYMTGWPNILHNWVNRSNTSRSNPLVNVLILALFLGYLMTPPVIYFLFKNRTRLLKRPPIEGLGIFAVAALVPLCVFFLVSFKREIGGHWLLSFLPFAYIAAVQILDNKQIVKCIRFSFRFSIMQVLILITVSFVPFTSLKPLMAKREFASLVVYLRPEQMLTQIHEYSGRFILATKSFSKAAVLEYWGQERVIVMGKGSRHGRHDDILTNFKELDGLNIAVLLRGTLSDSEYRQCFERVEIRHFTVEEASFSLMLGYGFKYPQYREMYLTTVLERFYQLPDWLPGSGGFFHQKYDF